MSDRLIMKTGARRLAGRLLQDAIGKIRVLSRASYQPEEGIQLVLGPGKSFGSTEPWKGAETIVKCGGTAKWE